VVGDHSWRPPEGAPHVTPPSGARYGGTRDSPPPGSGRGSCHPSQGGFPHISPTSGPASRRPEDGVSPPLTGHGGSSATRILCPPPSLVGVSWGDLPSRGSIAREDPGARERPRVGAPKPTTAERLSGVQGLS